MIRRSASQAFPLSMCGCQVEVQLGLAIETQRVGLLLASGEPQAALSRFSLVMGGEVTEAELGLGGRTQGLGLVLGHR